MKKHLCLYLFFAVFALSERGIATTTHPQQIVVVGDSDSDSGNFPRVVFDSKGCLHHLFQPAIEFVNAPLTDGTTWAVWLADALKTEWLLPSTQHGSNYAFAGSTTSGGLETFIPSMLEQTASISDDIPRNSPVFIWGGSNDFLILGLFTAIPPELKDITSSNIVEMAQISHDKDFETLVVFNINNLAIYPAIYEFPYSYFNPDPALVSAEGLECNRLIAEKLAEKPFPVLGIDVNALTMDIIAHPSLYGFSNVIDAAVPITQTFSGKIVPPPGGPIDGYLKYYDGLHLTHKYHRTLSDFVYTTLMAPSFFGGLSQKSFSVSRMVMTNIDQQSLKAFSCYETNMLRPFISGDYQPLINGANLRTAHEDSDGGDVVYGLSVDFNPSLSLGIAGSYSKHAFKEHAHLTHYDSELTTNGAAAYLNYQNACWRLFGGFSTSWNDFTHLKRKFDVGSATHEAHGKTRGIDYLGEVKAAYLGLYFTDNLSMGPMVDIQYQHASIDGYHERKARIGNLEFKKYHNDMLTTGLGWEIRYDSDMECSCFCENYFVDFYASINQQWLDCKKNLRFRQISFGENIGIWPVDLNKRYCYASTGLSLHMNHCGGLSSNIGYHFNGGNKGIAQHAFMVGISYQ